MVDKKIYKENVKKYKTRFDIKKYCDNNFNELVLIFNKVKSIIPSQRPNYNKYINFIFNTI